MQISSDLSRTILTALVLALAPAKSIAQDIQDYQCTIRALVTTVDDGPVMESERKAYVGKMFSINRQSGVMTGALKNAVLSEPVVVDFGSSQNAFKAFSIFKGAGSYITVINVREFDDGPLKPFLYTSNESVYSGVCRHF